MLRKNVINNFIYLRILMKIIKTIWLCIIISILCTPKIYAQETLKITIEQAERWFLEKNLQLLAERYNICIADAAIVQAKLLNNPTVGVGDINFWHPNANDALLLSPTSFGNKIVFSVELEQIVRTAGKRRKLVNLEKVSKKIAIQEFEAFLLGLKTELRTNLHEVIYRQSYLDIIGRLQKSVHNLVLAYKNQASAGNIAKSELIRLQVSLIELETEANEILAELRKLYKDLKILLNIAPDMDISIQHYAVATKNPAEILLTDLFETAEHSRPEFLLLNLKIDYNEKLLVYEKSHRAPDVELSLNYDRYGGVWKDFVGFGLRVDIPAFNRNQGNIKIAKLRMEQSNYNAEYQRNVILHEIVENYEHYTRNYNYYRKLIDNNFSEDLEIIFEAYSRNLLNKNINMLEYIDFMYAYKTTKQAILTAKRDLDINFEELQLSINNEIK
jgi:cobalt-zinc-cadmium efflux system outer membrane protein